MRKNGGCVRVYIEGDGDHLVIIGDIRDGSGKMKNNVFGEKGRRV